MTRYSKFFIASLALLAMTVSASQAKADIWRHIQNLALDIQLKSDRLMGETHHYVHTPNYQRMIRCVSNMRQRAVRVHVLSIQHGCLDEMSRQLARLDRQFHDVERLFDSTECESTIGIGHVHGSTAHVRKLLKRIEDCIHHIRDDISALQPVRPVYRKPLPPKPYAGYGTGGYGTGYVKPGYGTNCDPYTGRCDTGYAKPWKSGYRYGTKRGGISYHDGNFGFSIGF